MAWLLGVGSLVLGGVGTAMSSSAQRQAGSDERRAAEGEAIQLERRAGETVAAGTFDARRIRKQAEQILSSMRARAAAGNNDTLDGSVQEVAKETVKASSIDQLLVMMDAENEASKDRYAATVSRATGARSARLAQSRATATGISGATTLLSGGADWRQKYGSARRSEPTKPSRAQQFTIDGYGVF